MGIDAATHQRADSMEHTKIREHKRQLKAAHKARSTRAVHREGDAERDIAA